MAAPSTPNATPAGAGPRGPDTNWTAPWCWRAPVPGGLPLSLGLLSLLGNALVLAAVARARRLRTPTHLFTCCLAAADLLLGAGRVLEAAATLLPGTGARHLDDALDALTCSALVSGLCSLGAIAVDRHVSVFHALRYRSIVTPPRAGRAAAALWAASLLSGALAGARGARGAVPLGLAGLFLAVLALTAVLYAHMLARACRHARGPPRALRPPGRGRGLRGAATLALLLGVLLLGWGPLFLHLSLAALCPQHPACGCVTGNLDLALALRACSAALDPLIYAFRSPELRKALRPRRPGRC